MRTNTLRVLVVDDHRTVADAVALAVSREAGMECVGTAGTAAEALSLSAALTPDAVVMDVRLGDEDGIDVTARLTAGSARVRVVILTAYVDHELMTRAAEADACALMPKDGSLAHLLEALRVADRGRFLVHPDLLGRLMRRPSHPYVVLTAREHKVLELLSTGQDIGSISTSLGISRLTCRGYVKTLLSKLDAHSQLEAVVTAMRLGLVHLPKGA
ncbi:MAG TPA: response regulator transcription factor [Intrasporangium sp.]|uniref:response regulator transcription factor n=1 Tax=Intrasporangium sp. TaxID=1925024 RepID=UPI002D76D918|nr:response regulator transcription factor [Intrasporangium sp.]HET7398768.1 response regulator transcription factor [Intrasporangium sp.]